MKRVLIWNGIDYKVVSVEKFQKNVGVFRGYVVSRRLFVTVLDSKENSSEIKLKVNQLDNKYF